MFYKIKNIYFKIIIFLIFVFKLTFSSSYAKDNSLLLMITEKTCLICMVWEKQIGEIYPKTEIANKFPLSRIEMKDFVNYSKHELKKTNVTPTFIFIRNNNEQGRIEGYTSPEMFWWQVDEIVGD
jgi:thioredoxin-related protein|tara:strand:+ start:52 stop:426 length:375 start_codon:yes stop_codon:yes gene_type:complete